VTGLWRDNPDEMPHLDRRAPEPAFCQGLEKHRVRAVMSDGELQHLLAPAYHGNPVGDGALVFIHPGWQLLDDLEQAGFAVSAALVFDPGQGMVSNNCPFADGVSWPLVFRAVKA
jgi:hypothetical protein